MYFDDCLQLLSIFLKLWLFVIWLLTQSCFVGRYFRVIKNLIMLYSNGEGGYAPQNNRLPFTVIPREILTWQQSQVAKYGVISDLAI